MPTPVSESKPIPTFPELKPPKNLLAQCVKIINEGHILALHTEEACQVFHNLAVFDLSQGVYGKLPEYETKDLSTRTVYYLDCNSQPQLLGKGELGSFIKNKIPTVTELPSTDALRKKIIEQVDVPNKKYCQLG